MIKKMKLKIQSLDEKWHEMGEVILHSCFQCLVNWVEKEHGLMHCNYEAHKEQVDECEALYDWWKTKSTSIDHWDTEANDNLEKLIKIRHFLWT